MLRKILAYPTAFYTANYARLNEPLAVMQVRFTQYVSSFHLK